MDEMLLWAVLTVILLVCVIYIQLLERGKFSDGAEGLHERLDVLENSLGIVANVLERLPDLVPSFHLPAANPLSQILEFLQSMKVDGPDDEPSNVGAALRGPEGRFSDGTEESEEPPETG